MVIPMAVPNPTSMATRIFKGEKNDFPELYKTLFESLEDQDLEHAVWPCPSSSGTLL